MNKKRFFALLLAFTLAGILLASPALAVQQQQPTPTPYYLPSQLFATYSVDIPECYWETYYSGFVPCFSPEGTAGQTLEAIWPTTIRTFEFSLSKDTWLLFEVDRFIEEGHPVGWYIGTLGVNLEQLGGDGKWKWYQHITIGYTINKGVQQPATFDENWASKAAYNPNWQPLPAGQYRIFAWGEFHNGTTLDAYWPSRGTIKVYSFDNVPPPSEPPAQMVTPTLTLEAGKPPVSGDLSIENAFVMLQAVEGGKLVGGRDVAVLVKPYWAYQYPEGLPSGYKIQVTVNVDDALILQNTADIGTNFEFILPASLFPEGSDTQHKLSIRAQTVGALVEDTNQANNNLEKTFTTYASHPMRLLFVRIQTPSGTAIGYGALDKFAGEAIAYLRQVYPVPRVERINGSYLVLPGAQTKYMVSLEVAKTFLMYNNQRCLKYLPDGTTQSIVPCNIPPADLAVGVFPDRVYGDLEGWLYGRGSKTWSKWMDWTAEGVGWTSGGRGELDRAPITSVNNPTNSAHEIGHHFDREDEYDNNLGIPIQATLIWRDGKFFTPPFCTRVTCVTYYNFMGNAGVGLPSSDYWVNADTWNIILNNIRQQGMARAPIEVASLYGIPPLRTTPTEVDGPALLVMGTLDAQGNAAILTVDRLYHYTAPSATTGEYRLEALDDLGNSPGWADFNTYPLDIDQQVPFLVTIPLEGPGNVYNLATEIRLSRNGSTIASLRRSPSAPTASFATTPDLSADPITLSWTVQDADGGSLRSSVYYTADDGQTWQVVALDLSASQIEIDAAALPGGNAQFRVVVSDGLNETTILTPPTAIPDRLPSVAIDLPWGAAFTEGEPVIVSAYAYDSEDGDLPETSLIWSDETGQQIGQGSLLKAYPAPGAHTLVVTAIDSQGQQASASVTVDVQGKPPLTGLWSPMLVLYLIGGLVGSLGLAVIGRGLWLAVTPAESGLAALQKEGNAWIRRYQAGQVAPNAVQQILDQLRARDRQGIWWAFDPFKGQWLRWDGQVWRPTLPPKLRGGRLGCGLALIIAGLLVITAMAVALWWFGT